ncbi:hypothetical protein HDU88_006473 [Geranomyces variabilis]|nr:hypothetical protein HDU88_006473 [Geranomyces variabilis]
MSELDRKDLIVANPKAEWDVLHEHWKNKEQELAAITAPYEAQRKRLARLCFFRTAKQVFPYLEAEAGRTDPASRQPSRRSKARPTSPKAAAAASDDEDEDLRRRRTDQKEEEKDEARVTD